MSPRARVHLFDVPAGERHKHITDFIMEGLEAMSVQMVRPPWHEFIEKVRGSVVMCTCARDLHGTGHVREHWQLGHFDYVVGPNVIVATPDDNRRVLGERRQESREKIAGLERRLSKIHTLAKATPRVGWTHGRINEVLDVIQALAADSDIPNGPQQPEGLNQPNNQKDHDRDI